MVRGDSKATARTKLLFCTYGVLLRRIQGDPLLQAIDYVILDEVHERGLESDFSLALLLSALSERTNLRLILMSATIATDKFANYLGKSLALGARGPDNFTQSPHDSTWDLDTSTWDLDDSARGPDGSTRPFARTSAPALSSTFVPSPVLFIPGYTYPVTEFYKGDFEGLLRVDESEYTGGYSDRNRRGGGSRGYYDNDDGEVAVYDPLSSSVRIGGGKRKGTVGGTGGGGAGVVDYDLAIRLVLRLAMGEAYPSQKAVGGVDYNKGGLGLGLEGVFAVAEGCILVFFPGVPEINRMLLLLEQTWRQVKRDKS